MAKRRRQTDSDSDSDGTTPTEATTYNTIFIDTSLDTHLAMIVSDSDTITILKEKIVCEHTRCFPEIGDIEIHALKVKRKGYFYHLPDYMHVKSAFEGAKKSWFLYVDVSSLKVHNDMQQLAKPDVSNQKALVCIEHCPQGHDQQDLLPDERFKTPSAIHDSANGKVSNGSDSRPADITGEVSKDIAMEVGCNADALCNDLSSGTSRSSALKVKRSDVIFEKNRVSETISGFKDDKIRDDHRNIECFTSIGHPLETATVKKHKSRRYAVVACSASKDNNASIRASNKNASHLETATTVKSTLNEEDKKRDGPNVVSEPLKDDHHTSNSTRNKTKRKRIKDSVHHHDQAAASILSSTHVVEVEKSFERNAAINSNDLQNLSYAAVGSENNVQHEVLSEPSELSQNQMQHGHYQDEGKESSLPGSSKDVDEPYDVNLDGKIDISEQIAESQKARVSSEKHDETKVEDFPPPVIPILHDVKNNIHHALHADTFPDNDEPTIDQADKTREERELSPNRDPEVMLSSLKHVRDEGKADTSIEDPNLSAKFLNVHRAIEDGNSSGSKKKKKKAKKSSAKVLDMVDMNQDNNNINGISSPALNIAANANMSDELKSNERFVPHTQTDQTRLNEEDRDLSLHNHSEAIMSPRCRPSDRNEADATATESGFTTKLSDANIAKERKISGSRKKKTARKSAAAVCQDTPNMEQADNIASHLTTVGNWHSAEKFEEDKSFLSCAEKKEKSKRKSSDASARNACRKADKLSGDEETLRPITQIAETEVKGENMDGRMRNMEKSQNMGKNNIQDVPTKEQGNEIERGHLNEANRGIESAGNIDKIVKKKMKKNQSSAENNRESLPINDKKVNEEITALNDRLQEVDAPSKEQGEVKALMQLNQTNKSCENTENVERKSRKKTKKNQNPTANGHSSLPTKDQVAVEYVGDLAASSDRLGEVDTSSKAPESLVHMPLVLDPSNKTQENAGNTIKKGKKTTKGNRSSAADSRSNLPTKDQGVVQDTAASVHRWRELDSPSKTTRNTRKRHLNQLAVSESECQKIAVENNFEGAEIEVNACTLAEVSKREVEEVNFKQYFMPAQHQSEVVMKLNAETIAEKKAEENGVPSVSTAPELQQDLLKSYENQGGIVTSAGKAKNTTKSSKGMKTKKKMEKHGVPHAPTLSDLEEIKTLQKPVATAISNGSDTNKSVPARTKENDKSWGGTSSSSSSESAKIFPLKKRDKKESGLRHHVVTSKKTSSKLGGEVTNSFKLEKRLLSTPRSNFKDVNGEVANSSRREKSLLSTPVSIFKDVHGESSGDENGLVDSDASTRTPSDNSSSSGYSVDGNDLSDTARNGASGVKRKGGSRKSILKPELSGPRQIPMDMILRSSSRFKKAKLTATKQLEDAENQPVEFVPDSEAHE